MPKDPMGGLWWIRSYLVMAFPRLGGGSDGRARFFDAARRYLVTRRFWAVSDQYLRCVLVKC